MEEKEELKKVLPQLIKRMGSSWMFLCAIQAVNRKHWNSCFWTVSELKEKVMEVPIIWS